MVRREKLYFKRGEQILLKALNHPGLRNYVNINYLQKLISGYKIKEFSY